MWFFYYYIRKIHEKMFEYYRISVMSSDEHLLKIYDQMQITQLHKAIGSGRTIDNNNAKYL